MSSKSSLDIFRKTCVNINFNLKNSLSNLESSIEFYGIPEIIFRHCCFHFSNYLLSLIIYRVVSKLLVVKYQFSK